MGIIFNQQNDEEVEELEQRVDELEDRLENLKDEKDTLDKIVANIDQYGTIEREKSGKVETLDEPKVAWKATKHYILKLVIPKGARVVHPNGDSFGSHYWKKRTDKAMPVGFYDVRTLEDMQQWVFQNDEEALVYDETDYCHTQNGDYEYVLGEMATPASYLDARVDEGCTSGIHFFTNKEDALDWY